jgi:HK97 family phage major capsid protein
MPIPIRNDFKSLGEQLQKIATVGIKGRAYTDDRLLVKNAASGLNEGVGSEGGFLIRPTFGEGLLQKTYDNSLLLSLCDKYEPEKWREFKILTIDEANRSNGNRLGGVRVYRLAEAGQMINSKPKFGQWALNGIKIIGMVYFTEELLQDVPTLEKIFTDAFGLETAYTLEKEVYRGTGVGQCLGILNSNALIIVNAEQEQSANTIAVSNIEGMWARCWGPSRKSSIWVYNQNAEKQILGAVKDTRYFATDDPYNTLLGRPLIPMEACSKLGTKGDISLICPSEYGICKDKNPSVEVSAHVNFLTGELALRYVLTINGQPKWKEPVIPENTDGSGNDSQSPFVTLATRNQ